MSTDQGHLEWIYDRLRCKHGEPVNADYMLRFREIIDGFCGHIVPTVEEVTASPYAIELDETVGQVLTCPECSSTSIGFSTPPFGITARKETRGPINVDIITLSFRCEDCGDGWQLQMESCRGRQGQALSVALEINPTPPSLEVAEQPEQTLLASAFNDGHSSEFYPLG